MFTIKKNLCALDRAVRFVITVTLFLYAFLAAEQIGDAFLQIAIIVFATINLVSVLTGWCVVYRMANISTCKVK